jgi:DNA helicase-2/ATP-dependent DNA helicase PcrA
VLTGGRPGRPSGSAQPRLQDVEELARLLAIPFSPEQREAITAPLAPGLIVAGAGAGKTSVMAARVVWLVGTGAVAPGGVLGLTFTNKAAAELMLRIRSGLRCLGGAAAAAAEDVHVGTYHAFAGQLLREFGLLLGREGGADLMSPVRQRQIVHRVVCGPDAPAVEGFRGTLELGEAVVALDSQLADSGVAAELLATFDTEVLRALASGERQQRIGERMAAAARARQQLTGLVEEFRRAKQAAEAVDFADIVRLGQLLAGGVPAVGEALRSRHAVVLLDEYQDTSIAQRAMLQGLFGHGHPVTAVGDPCQAIYGWRGASPWNMDGFPDHFPLAPGQPAPVYQLATNRRSGAAILGVANRAAEPLRTVHRAVAPLQPDQARGAGEVVGALLPDADAELAWVVEQLQSLGRPWSQMAVLARTNATATAAVAALRSAGVPVAVHGRQALLALPEVRWVVRALRVVDDPTANDALVPLLAGPPWSVGDRDLAALAARAERLARGNAAEPAIEAGGDLLADLLDAACGACDRPLVLFDALESAGEAPAGWFSAEAVARFADAARLIRSWQRRSGAAVADLVRWVVVESGLLLEAQLGAFGHAPGRPQDADALVALLDLARSFDDVDGRRTLPDFLAWLRRAEDLPDGPTAPLPAAGEAVTVMTVHAAKGLEFPVVAVPGLVAGGFPSAGARGRWPTDPTVVPPQLRPEPLPEEIGAFPSDPAAPRAAEHDAFVAASRELEQLEEVRLGYVAFTRARDLLLLSGHRWGRTQARPLVPGAFLQAVLAAAQDGEARVDVWTLPPDEGATNPMLAAAGETRGTPGRPGAADEATARAAELVRSAPARPGPTPWDDTLAMLRRERQAAAAPIEVPLPRQLSVGGAARLVRDPQSFAADLVRPVPSPLSAAARVGTELHEWLAAQGGQLALWDLLGPDQADPALAALQEAFRSCPFADLSPVVVEHPIALPLGGTIVQGRLDAVFEVDGRHWVVDWKTGATGSADPLQLAAYRLAWAAERGLAVSDVVGCFVHLRQRRYEVFDDLPAADALQQLLAQAVAGGPEGRDGAGTGMIVPTSARSW